MFLGTQWFLAELVDKRQTELRALTIEHGIKYTASEKVLKELMDKIAQYVRSSEDVERVFQSMYEPEPINQVLALLFFILLSLFTVPETYQGSWFI